MDATSIRTGRLAWLGEINAYLWRIFFVTWLGWALDATDFGLFSLVLRPALTELLGGQPTLADIGRVGGYLSMVGLLGWACGGFLFGICADYIGRIRALAISILMFSIFTACQGFAQTPLQLGIFRFLGGLGTGAEVVVGITLVAEAFAHVHRAKVCGVMMTGGAFGSLIGGQIYALVGPYGWRSVFFVGIAPALLLLLLRRNMGETGHFRLVTERRAELRAGARDATAHEREFMRFVPLQLFNRQNRFSTLVGLLFCLGTLLSIWTSVIWLPTIQSLMLEKDGVKGVAAITAVGHGMMLWGVGGIIGYSTFGFLADAIGRRPTIVFFNIGALASGLVLYLALETYEYYPLMLVVFGYFVFGVFSGHAVYLPELFPTHVRATAVSFCNGSGRVITSFGPLVAGLLVVPFGGSFNKAAAVMTGCVVLSILAMVIGRETRHRALPQ
ncbi:MAG: MFS transporter [Acetobacteraceae bacterium]|nr:MFS transporter [Acetobacteraceae bacterium]